MTYMASYSYHRVSGNWWHWCRMARQKDIAGFIFYRVAQQNLTSETLEWSWLVSAIVEPTWATDTQKDCLWLEIPQVAVHSGYLEGPSAHSPQRKSVAGWIYCTSSPAGPSGSCHRATVSCKKHDCSTHVMHVRHACMCTFSRDSCIYVMHVCHEHDSQSRRNPDP